MIPIKVWIYGTSIPFPGPGNEGPAAKIIFKLSMPLTGQTYPLSILYWGQAMCKRLGIQGQICPG